MLCHTVIHVHQTYLIHVIDLKYFSCDGIHILFLQAQALIRKSHVYQQIDEALRKLPVFHPNVYHNVPRSTTTTLSSSSNSHHHNNYRYHYNDDNDDDDEGKMVTSLHRDAAINNLRLLNIFYGYSPATFALAVNLLDRLLGKVKVRGRRVQWDL